MLHFLDDKLTNSNNAQKAYINVPTYDSCTRCDPQQDLIPSYCTARDANSTMTHTPAAR